MQVKTRNIATSFAAVLVLLLPATAFAQTPTLDQVDSLITAGQAQSARTALAAWLKDNKPDARSTWLTGRLATRAQDAEDAYLDVTLSYGSSPYAAEALLRLGQSRFAAGDSKQGAVYLQRLLSDYPRSEHRATAQEWLARAPQTTAQAKPVVVKPAPAAPAPVKAAVEKPSVEKKAVEKPAPTPASSPTTASAQGRYSIQVGAFREIAGARSVARELEKAGFTDVRLITVPANALVRVRVGKFEKSAASSTLATKLKAAGFPAAPVSDVHNEQPVRD